MTTPVADLGKGGFAPELAIARRGRRPQERAAACGQGRTGALRNKNKRPHWTSRLDAVVSGGTKYVRGGRDAPRHSLGFQPPLASSFDRGDIPLPLGLYLTVSVLDGADIGVDQNAPRGLSRAGARARTTLGSRTRSRSTALHTGPFLMSWSEGKDW